MTVINTVKIIANTTNGNSMQKYSADVFSDVLRNVGSREAQALAA